MITRESLALQQYLVLLLRRPIEARHEEMEIRRERLHRRDFAFQGPNDWRQPLGSLLVDV